MLRLLACLFSAALDAASVLVWQSKLVRYTVLYLRLLLRPVERCTGGKGEGHVRIPVSPRGVLRNMELGAKIPSSPQSVNRALHRHKYLSMRHRVCITPLSAESLATLPLLPTSHATSVW